MTVDDVECIEEGGTEPTIAWLRRLAARPFRFGARRIQDQGREPFIPARASH